MMAPGERVMPDETARRKLIDQWKKSLKTTAVSFDTFIYVFSQFFVFSLIDPILEHGQFFSPKISRCLQRFTNRRTTTHCCTYFQ